MLLEIALDHRIHALHRRLRPTKPRDHRLAQDGIGLAHRVLEQFLLVAEIVQHDALGGAGLGGHFFQCRAGNAFALQHREGSLPQFLTAYVTEALEFHGLGPCIANPC